MNSLLPKNLDALQMNISSGMVVASRHWRRICQTALVNYGISEACAVPLLMIGRLGEGVRQVTVAQAALRVIRAFESATHVLVTTS